MSQISYQPVFISIPQAPHEDGVGVISLEKSESFVIDGIEYTVEPDVVKEVAGGKNGGWIFRKGKGFAGRKFVIVTFDGRRIVTHNLWMGENTDEPDTASFEGAVAKPVSLAGTYGQPWARR